VNVTIVDTFYRYPYTASAVICEKQQSANNPAKINCWDFQKHTNFLKKQMWVLLKW